LKCDSPSFAGGPGRDAVDLFLSPNEASAALERARYPRAIAVAVGSPKLDAWSLIPAPQDGTVAVTFHWQQIVRTEDNSACPEAGWAWPTWRDRIEQLAKVRPVIGHSHPRARRDLEPWWASIGVEYVPNAADLLKRADTLILDNSSLGFEWAALDRHTVWLRGQDWTDQAHGLRFGDPLPGPELAADAPLDALVSAVNDAAEPCWFGPRAEVRERVYGNTVGRASRLAADAILDRFG
jgi:hypothetical protein